MTDPAVSNELYQAYSRSYSTEANKRAIAFAADLAFAAAALVLTVLTAAEKTPGFTDFLTTWLPLAALLWLSVREIGLISIDQTHRRVAVNIQEQLDLMNWKDNRWEVHWNRLLAGDPIPARTIKQLATANSTATMAPDYWIATDDIPDNAAALFRVKQTAAWGAEGHHRYAGWNHNPALILLVLAGVSAVLLDVSARETAAAVMAIAPFLVGRIQSSREHAALADRRCSLEQHIRDVLDPARPNSDADVRTAQDSLYRLRMETRRIPTWLYDRHAERDRESIDAALIDEIAAYRAALGR